jgi:hypothetical protein
LPKGLPHQENYWLKSSVATIALENQDLTDYKVVNTNMFVSQEQNDYLWLFLFSPLISPPSFK